jgi:hypothetical protein
VRVLAPMYLPALVEFYDYRSRKDHQWHFLGAGNQGRDGLEALTGEQLEASPILAIMAGPTALIRGIAQYGPANEGAADADFTIDESLDGDHVSDEMLYRLADHARAAGITRFKTSAAEGSAMLAAIGASGFPFTREAGTDNYVIDIEAAR